MRQATDLLGRFRGRAIVLIRGFTPTLTGIRLGLAARFARTLGRFGLGLGLALGRLDKRALARCMIVATGLGLRIAALLVLVAAIAVALGLTFAVLALLLFAARVLFLLGGPQKTQVMLGMLLKILCRNPITGKLRITRQLIVFVDDLLWRAAHFAFRAGTIEHAVRDIAHRPVVVTVRLIARAGFG